MRSGHVFIFSIHLFPANHMTFLTFPQEHFSLLHHQYPGSRLLIVSNTAGSVSSPSPSDPALSLAKVVAANTGVTVLTHSLKKPSCGKEIMDYFRNTDEKEGLRNIRPDQIAIVGDRLLTDMCLANEMGSWGVWVKDGVVDLKSKSVVSSNSHFSPYTSRSKQITFPT
jgi:phosphatidylglycerophosphatase GEP4